VSGFEWERTVEIEERKTVREESWKEEVRRARASSRGAARSITRSDSRWGRATGSPCFASSPSTRQRVAYDADRWSVVRTLRSTGKDKSPRWPDIR
jgi:hypothetical protein